jgi:hypothetical protein
MSKTSAPETLPFSSHDSSCVEYRTLFPNYSTNAQDLYDMILTQARFPPVYSISLWGTHTETVRQQNKEQKKKVIDFSIKINMTHTISPYVGKYGHLELLPNNVRGYRGTRFPSFTPTVMAEDDPLLDSEEQQLKAWCESYVADPASIKSFVLKREITNIDTQSLEQLVRSAIDSTKYRGHVNIDFITSHQQLTVFSPGKINEWRVTNWIRWMFYVTFLWLFSWPVLFLVTRKYAVVRAVFPYANMAAGDGMDDSGVGRRFTLMSETEWFQRWESAIRRAVLTKMKTEDRMLDDDYLISTSEADARGFLETLPAQQQLPINTGNAFADGALGVLREGMRIADSRAAMRGWGGDC